MVIDNADQKGIDESLFEGRIRYAVPFDQLAREGIADAKLRGKLKNLIYVGVVAERLGIPTESLRAAIDSVFSSKPKVAGINFDAAQLGYDYAK